ncbi:MAG: twin-arginine translocation signal domain-containing protein, partial [Gammaproteobacteria bacterium]
MTDSRDEQETSIKRREFLKTGTLAGAAALATPGSDVRAQSNAATSQQRAAATPEQRAAATPPMTAESEARPPADVQVLGEHERSGSDYMVDVIKSLDFDYICANPGSSFRGLH